MWPWRKRFLLCVPRSIFGKGVAVPIAPKPCGFSDAPEKGIPLWKATHFHRSGRRSQAGKWRTGKIRSISEDKRKGPLLSRVLVLTRISRPNLPPFRVPENSSGRCKQHSYSRHEPQECGTSGIDRDDPADHFAPGQRMRISVALLRHAGLRAGA